MTNKEPKYTLAPWYSDEVTIWTGDQRLSDNGGYIIAEVCGIDKLANAKLISAAPDLLSALQSLLASTPTIKDIGSTTSDNHLVKSIRLAEQAIEKALTL